MPTTASVRDLLRWRLAAHRVAPPGVGVREVVDELLALQAQDLAQGLWAVGARTEATRADVLAAFDRGEIVRSWPMRGTLHITRPDDLRWMLALTVTRTEQGLTGRYRQLGLDGDDLDRAADVTRRELSGRRMTRDEFARTMESAGIGMTGQRAPHVIGHLARRQIVVWGPSATKQQSLVLFDEWAPPSLPPPSRDESLGLFAAGYLRGRGPASVRDFAWWSGLTLADARAGFAGLGDRLEAVEVEGSEYWMLAASALPTAPLEGVHLLAGFDEYLLGYRDRSHPLAGAYLERVVPGANGIFFAIIVCDGRIVGTWRREIAREAVTVTIDPFEPLTRAQLEGVELEVARFGRFHGLPAQMR
ncbi:MAG: hypothetical protein RI885_639 [Actinomycetota bacterium]|jgi:hypothetical protein